MDKNNKMSDNHMSEEMSSERNNQKVAIENELHVIDYKLASAKYYHQVNQLSEVCQALNQLAKDIELLEITKNYAQATIDLEDCLYLKGELQQIATELQIVEHKIMDETTDETSLTLSERKRTLIAKYQEKERQIQNLLINPIISKCKPNYQKIIQEDNYSADKQNKARQEVATFGNYLSDYRKKNIKLNKEKVQHLTALKKIKDEIQATGHQRAIEKDLLVNLPYEQQADYYTKERTKLRKEQR